MTTSTENLIDDLAGGLKPVPARLLERRLMLALVGGALVVLALVLFIIEVLP